MKRGKLIVVEGACDGIGKSTQYSLLEMKLIGKGFKVAKHHFPSYNTPQGAGVEKYLSGTFGEAKELSPYFINSLYAHDRAITWRETLREEYESGKIILLDRYTTSSLIYQSALIEDIDERKKFIDYICDFEYNKLKIAKPDKVIFLKAPFELVSNLRKSRKQNDGIENDIHERNSEFMRKVYENALFIADYLKWDIVECSENGKMRSIEDINMEILNRIDRK